MELEEDPLGEVAESEQDIDHEHPRICSEQEFGTGEFAVDPGDDDGDCNYGAKDRRAAYSRIDAVDPTEPCTIFALIALQVTLRSGSGVQAAPDLIAVARERLNFTRGHSDFIGGIGNV